MKERLAQLDSLRGIAAVIVVLTHLIANALIAVMPGFLRQALTATLSPFSVLTNGRAAVISFFILSGFVLSLPILQEGRIHYSSYLVRRFFRLYIPYLAAIALSLIFYSLCRHHLPIGALSDDVNHTWLSIHPSVIWEHIIAVGSIHSSEIDVVIWSLVHEMRISIVFPFVVLLLKDARWFYSIAIGMALSALGIANSYFHWQTYEGMPTTLFDSLHYLNFFIIGMLLAKHRMAIIRFYTNLSRRIRIGVLAGAFIFYNYAIAPVIVLKEVVSKHAAIEWASYMMLGEWITAIGVIGFIVIALSSAAAKKLLTRRAPLFLGNISYSLYLYHFPIMLLLIFTLYGAVPLTLLMGISFTLSIGISYISYRWIEKPSIALGRFLTRERKKTTEAGYPAAN
ncbi:acyltransferase [Cohnella sp. AR92]|uniref:acyltransferase family protein n=1 Tax=Cohnella sp. AR92 TaxID=648716 RepID=UPI00131558F7|nr:acyltransferase [Cohnella sp. AR92]